MPSVSCLEIASRPAGEPVSLKARWLKRREISLKYLEQIVNELCRAGMLTSVRGPQGGYLLSRQPRCTPAQGIFCG